MITRRGVIQGLISFVAAPSVIRVAEIMPVRSFLNVQPTKIIIPSGNGVSLAEIREILLPGLKPVRYTMPHQLRRYLEVFAEPPK
jgi:hypothetical protein